MDERGQRENRRHRMDYYKGGSNPSWNMLSQYQVKDQNTYLMNQKMSMIYAERDAAIEDRDLALAEKKAALEEREIAIHQRDMAMDERDNALRERDNALAALQFQENAMNNALVCTTPQNSRKRQSQTSLNAQVTEAFPLSVVSADPTRKVARTTARKPKKKGEDLNKRVTTDGSKAEWDAAQELTSLDLITFDETSMPIPVCSCTKVPRQCYKWGNGGWQSSCCTTSINIYPLPIIPNKKHARIGGRKMSGGVFRRLLTRAVNSGHDLSIPLDLRNFWAKHGTNRYITIK